MKYIYITLIFGLLLTSLNVSAQLKDDVHSKYDALLIKYVDSKGKVDYNSFLDSKSQLNDYLVLLSNCKPSGNETKETRLAYWINLYNASTIYLILEHYPVRSITEIYNGKPWDKKWINISGDLYSLNQIENEIIRPKFKEPRIHFAVNCAALSCPPLMNKAWKSSSMESDFEKMTTDFINDDMYNVVNKDGIKISKIFEWYQSDFDDILRFINKYYHNVIKEQTTISYLEYNWNLNEQ